MPAGLHAPAYVVHDSRFTWNVTGTMSVAGTWVPLVRCCLSENPQPGNVGRAKLPLQELLGPG